MTVVNGGGMKVGALCDRGLVPGEAWDSRVDHFPRVFLPRALVSGRL